MRHPRFTAGFSRITASVLAASLASVSLLPAAAAQGKEPAKPPADAPAAPAAKPPDKKTKDAARKAYAEGEKAYTAGNYDLAIENFKKAHALIPTPHAEFWIAMSLAHQGKDEEATKSLEALLASPEASKLGDDKTAEAKKKLDELKAKQGAEVALVSTPPGAQVTVDGQAQMGETPMTLKVQPGPHKIVVTLAGYEAKQLDLDVKAGDKLEQKLELKSADMLPPPEPVPAAPPPEPPPEPPPAPPAERSKVPAFITLGVAGAGAIVGTFFGIKALSAKSDFEDAPTNDGADDVERNALISDMAFGVAITLGVTGIVLLTSSDSSVKDASNARALPKRAKLNVAPYVSTQGGGAAARWTF
jgi:hypothetical protein